MRKSEKLARRVKYAVMATCPQELHFTPLTSRVLLAVCSAMDVSFTSAGSSNDASMMSAQLEDESPSILRVDEDMVAEIRFAARECQDRGLIAAARWASELILSIPQRKRQQAQRRPSPLGETTQNKLGAEEEDDIMVAQNHMRTRNYLKVIRGLKRYRSAKALWLRTYSEFLMSEKDAVRRWHKDDDTRKQSPTPQNAALDDLLTRVEEYSGRDAWLLFLQALFLSRLHRKEEALEVACQSIALFKWNWSLWQLLANMLVDRTELENLIPRLPIPSNHPLVLMLNSHVLTELNLPLDPDSRPRQQMDILLEEEYFPGSLWLKGMRAKAIFYSHDLHGSLVQFERIFKKDPERVDEIAVYSNILYSAGLKPQLNEIASRVLHKLEHNRPEVCCAVANHYSVRSEHEKAVKYLRRATELDRTYYQGWTLMGHEYLEMSNTHAAIECYRRAIDVNQKDYRAWFGLGQCYSILSMFTYALHYFQKAAALRPTDPGVWENIAQCYQSLGNMENAIPMFRRALEHGDEGYNFGIHLKLVSYFRSVQNHVQMVEHNRKIIQFVEMLQPHQLPSSQDPNLSTASVASLAGIGGLGGNKRLIVHMTLAMLEMGEHILKMHATGTGAGEDDLKLAVTYGERVMTSGTDYAPKGVELARQAKIALGPPVR